MCFRTWLLRIAKPSAGLHTGESGNRVLPVFSSQLSEVTLLMLRLQFRGTPVAGTSTCLLLAGYFEKKTASEAKQINDVIA